jgi:hypothetical protein
MALRALSGFLGGRQPADTSATRTYGSVSPNQSANVPIFANIAHKMSRGFPANDKADPAKVG